MLLSAWWHVSQWFPSKPAIFLVHLLFLGGRNLNKKEGKDVASLLPEGLVYARSPSSALYPFLGEGSPTKIDYRKKGSLILTSLLEQA